MGLYDTVKFEAGLEIEFPDIGVDPFEVTWQSKSISRYHPALDTYRVTEDGRLFKEDAELEFVQEEERPWYDEAIGGFESSVAKMIGSLREVHHGWEDTEYHGIFELYASIDGEFVSVEAKFTDGHLVAITRSD